MTEFLHTYHLTGPLIGLCTFLIIGLFHPLVIKGHYYFGTGCRWAFLAAGFICLGASVAVSSNIWSILLGVVAFSCFWSVGEVIQQQRRVERGWFPANPHRTRRSEKVS
ncbi:MAG: DUF4491 family protein [Muribaculaceae bacterium]|nr:DUF4491 family protein [Muribaculaceae bacterium]